jgi:hypothetical protein
VTRPDSAPVLRGMPTSQEDQSSSRKLGNDQGGNLDVMVLWTKKAECANYGLSDCNSIDTNSYNAMQALVDLAVAETNTAFTESGVHTMLNLVHSYREESYVESSFSAFHTALLQITMTKDGVMDNVHALRDQYGADLVALIIDDPAYCGTAWPFLDVDYMFSVTKWSCAIGYFTFGHEIG